MKRARAVRYVRHLTHDASITHMYAPGTRRHIWGAAPHVVRKELAILPVEKKTFIWLTTASCWTRRRKG